MKPRRFIPIILGLILVLALACGTTATPTPMPEPTLTPTAQADEPAASPTATEGATPQPTAVPQPTAPLAPEEVEVSQGTVRVMIGSFGNERFDPTFALGGHDYAHIVHGFLISSDVNEEGSRILVPGIAKKWEFSSDGLTWTLTIREGVKFHDGSDVTAADVAWTLKHCMGIGAEEYTTTGACLTLSGLVDHIEQTAPYQLDVVTELPLSGIPHQLSQATGDWVGIVRPEQEATHEHDAEMEAAYDRNPIGTGSMELVGHTLGQVMRFERFDDYYYQPANGFPTDKRVKFQFLELYLVPEVATRVAAIRAGDADIAPVGLAFRDQIQAGGGRLIFAPEGSYFWVRLFGCWSPEYPCHDQQVRQALGYALDKKKMRDQLYSGPKVMQVKGWSVVTPSTIGYVPELDPFPFNPEKAQQLMVDAGYPNGEGFGTLVVNTWVSAATPLLVESAQLAASMWEEHLGIDTEVRVGTEASLKEASSFNKELYGEVLWRDNETRIDAADLVRGSHGTPTGVGRIHSEPELAELTNNSLAAFPPKREQVLTDLYLRLRQESYAVGVGYVNIPFAVGPRIQTWKPYPLAFYISALYTIRLSE